jgi:hypothetical protein
MTSDPFMIEHPNEYKILGIMQELKKYENEHGILYELLLYTAVFLTTVLLINIKPMKILSEILSRFFNIPFKFKGATFYVYNLVLGFIIFIGILLSIFKLQSDTFTKNLRLDTLEKRLYRLKYKWIVEEQVWLLTMIFVELISIYRFSMIYDREKQLNELINMAEKKYTKETNEISEQNKIEENMPTQTSLNEPDFN